MNLLIHTDSKQSLRPLSFLSRTGNVLHSFRQSAFACLSFNKVEEVQHIIVIPSDSHSGINYPPTFVGPPLSLQKGAAYGMLPICKAFVCLPFYKRLFHIPLQSSWGALPLSMRSFIILSYFLTYKDGLRLMVGASLRSTLTASFSLRDFPQYAFRSSSVSWSCGKGITSGMVPSG